MFKYAPTSRRAMRKSIKSVPLNRKFHKTSDLSAPNDLEKLLEKSKVTEEKWNVMDGGIEEVTKKIQESDVDNGIDDEETYLSQYLTKREKEKDDLVGELEEARTSAILENRERDSMLGFLEIAKITTKKDIETFEFIENQLAGHEDEYDEVVRLLEELKSLKTSVATLIEEFHENDLPPITSRESNDEISQAQNSDTKSNLDDYADTSTEMPTYMDPED